MALEEATFASSLEEGRAPALEEAIALALEGITSCYCQN